MRCRLTFLQMTIVRADKTGTYRWASFAPPIASTQGGVVVRCVLRAAQDQDFAELQVRIPVPTYIAILLFLYTDQK